MPPSANVLILNGRVITADDLNPRAEAVAVIGSRIAFVGSNEEARAWRTPSTRVINAQGCTVMPGFIDSHFHLRLGSVELQNADLTSARSIEDLTTALRAYAQEHSGALWVNGSNIIYEIFPDNQRLTRHHLDAIIPDQPVAVMAYDHHTLTGATCRALNFLGLALNLLSKALAKERMQANL